ncbi:hypothetical protein K2173_018720 [Erythroxylum novogranatense]|uniref:Uncharacterized protein n=1 Tax=Erythroxylum novogranatense TaxID=1862640 RepID=A0AAV8T3C2_9ROSI|nr:hypothetical protein K2173_018720 [Erythroxylum novogranatense]
MVIEEYNNKKRVRDDPDELRLNSPEVKRIKDLMGVVDDSDPDPASQDLDSVMKSFEEEISASTALPVPRVDLTSESGESKPALVHLLEASDDELGLPPTTSLNSSSEVSKNELTDLLRVDSSESVEMGGLWGFEDQIPSYDSFGLAVVEPYDTSYVAFDDGLFEYSNVCLESSEYCDFS